MPNIPWDELHHAYGRAGNIPALLEQLSSFPPEDDATSAPWHSLWTSLFHEGDVYTASLAAVPVIVGRLRVAPERATRSFYALPASIEVARKNSGMVIPERIRLDYQQALIELGSLASRALVGPASTALSRAALAAIAVSSGQHAYAEFILEVPRDEVGEVLARYQFPLGASKEK